MASKFINIVAAAFLGSAAAVNIAILPNGNLEQADTAFHSFIQRHRREYKHGTAEYALREGLFEQRLAAVHAQNAKPGRLWKAAPSHFSDRTEAERKAVRGYRKNVRAHAKGQSPASLLQISNQTKPKLPASKSWAHLEAASKVPNQGACGSCWAIAVQAMLEAHDEIYNKNTGTRTFSAQQIIECTPNPRSCGGTGGCQGATVELGMDYVLKNGVATEEAHPYRAKDGGCTANKKVLTQTNGGASFGLMSYKTLETNAVYPLQEAVAKYGPVAVSAAADAWHEYSSGVFDGCKKDSVVDHAITLYGYGHDNGKKYWLIRNSWGSSWGEHGFIRLLRHSETDPLFCGTDNDNMAGLGCKGDPTSVRVCGMCGILFDSVVAYFNGSPGHGGSALADDSSTSADDEADSSTTNDDTLFEDEASPRLMRLGGQ